MSGRQLKFVLGPAVIVVTLIWIGYSAFQQLGAYDQTVAELYAMADTGGLAVEDQIRVTGEVLPGTIHYEPGVVRFDIKDKAEPEKTLQIQYVSNDPLPDAFRDYAEAVVTGTYAGEGVFNGTYLQAKCASKYERELDAGVVSTETSRLQTPAPAGR